MHQFTGKNIYGEQPNEEIPHHIAKARKLLGRKSFYVQD